MFYKGKSNSKQLYMILTYNMMTCHAQYLATNYQGQGHNFDSNFGEKSTFTEYGHVADKIIGNETYDNIQANTLLLYTHGIKRSTYFLFLQKNVAHQIKGNFTSNNMQPHILSLNTPSIPGVRSNGHDCLFQKIVMLHIKLKGMARTTTCDQPFCPYTQTRPLGWGQKVKTLFSSENGRVAYQIKGNKTCDNLQSNNLTLHTPDLRDRVNFFLLKVVVLHINLGESWSCIYHGHFSHE